jgi:hypothetical protein
MQPNSDVDNMCARRVSHPLAAVMLAVFFASCSGPPSHVQDGGLPDYQLVGRTVESKIDLPIRSGMVVYANGEIDLAVYRAKLADLGFSIRRYERAQITTVRKRGDYLYIRLNHGGFGPLAHKGHLRWIQPAQLNAKGTAIHLKFGRPLTMDDLRPETVAYALRDVLSIKGVSAESAARHTATPPPPAGPSTARLLSVQAQPSRVVPGALLSLSVHFEVTQAAPAQPLDLTVYRQVFRDEEPLFSVPREQNGSWPAGVHAAHFTLTVPPAAPPGVYKYRAWLSGGDGKTMKEALFEVQ